MDVLASGFRVAVVPVVAVVGRVGGLFKEVPLVVLRKVDVDVFPVADDEVPGLFVVVVPVVGRLVVVVTELTSFLLGDTTRFSLDASGLDLTSSGPERSTESTGVAGGGISTSVSVVGITSSVEAMMPVEGVCHDRREGIMSQITALRCLECRRSGVRCN